jgi:hypothetical protein
MRFLGLAVLLVVGCGPSRPPVDSWFGGHWIGTTVLSFDHGGSDSGDGALDIQTDTNADGATVFGLCVFSGGGFLDMPGTAESLRWQGSYTCPAYQANCGAAQMTYETASADLEAIDRLSAHAFGRVDGCGSSDGFSVSFLGHK